MITAKADSQSVVKSFSLYRVNGYKNIELESPTAAKIISAENGTGKTTILNALYGLLSGQYSYLRKVDFESLEITFRDGTEIKAKKKDILGSKTGIVSLFSPEEVDFFLDYGLSEDALTDLLYSAQSDLENVDKNQIFSRFYRESPHSRIAIIEKIEQLSGQLPEHEGVNIEIRSAIQAALDGHEVLYFPTYRRIETENPSLDPSGRTKRNALAHYNSLHRSAYEQTENKSLINFGLTDVESKLKNITDDIRRGTFEAYARISGKTLDQLLLGRDPTPKDSPTYDVAAIKVVLGRIGKSDSQTEERIIELISTGEIASRKHDYLRYFLSQMIEVYKEKQAQESAVETFVKVVSSYWEGAESEKVFEFEKVSAEASVRNTITNKKLKLSALSSGEKQVISTFARLYLELEKKYIVLIDEPELSLSMEWQRKFLPDILASSSCSQLIAITHSPFTFENILDPYAGPLRATYSDDAKIER